MVEKSADKTALTQIARDSLDQVLEKPGLTEEERRELYRSLVKETLRTTMPDIDFVGVGLQSIVVGHKDQEKVVAYPVEKEFVASAFKASQTFHIHRLLSLLFPHNIPKFYYLGFDDGVVSIRQRIKTTSDQSVTWPFDQVRSFLQETDIPARFDENAVNFEVGQDGGQYYLDTVKNYSHQWRNWDIQKIEDWAQTNQPDLSENQLDAIRKSVVRLREIGQTWELEINSREAVMSEEQIKSVALRNGFSEESIQRIIKQYAIAMKLRVG